MIRFERRTLASPDPFSGRPWSWEAVLDGGRRIGWAGLQTGPLTLDREAIEELCHRLLGFGTEALDGPSDRILTPATGPKAERPAVILHSTTPDLKTFDGDLDALVQGRLGGDFTTYKEARSVYLARPGDVVVGRTRAWQAASAAVGRETELEPILLEDVDHYYLSHALLHLASQYRPGSGSALDRLIARMRQTPRVIRLYAFEREMQIFLLWLAGQAGLDQLALEANRPALSKAWNRKAVLHPTVERAMAMAAELDGAPVERRLALEHEHCELTQRLGLEMPCLPGYTLVRRDGECEDFVHQLLSAATLLRQRYGLTTGCLKASESGDGARISPGLALDDPTQLAELGRRAHRHGDDYVLEAHITYGRATIAGQTLPTALSAHLRGGEVAPGATVQFMEGTSWKGNVLLDEQSLDLFSIPASAYRELRQFVHDFRAAFERHEPGLVIAGIDFAVGTVGGEFADSCLLGVQDLNISFTGAECLRAFLDKAQRANGQTTPPSGVTRIYRPGPEADHQAFLNVTRAFGENGAWADTVASIPGRWAMVGVTGHDPRVAIENLGRLESVLVAGGLIRQDPP